MRAPLAALVVAAAASVAAPGAADPAGALAEAGATIDAAAAALEGAGDAEARIDALARAIAAYQAALVELRGAVAGAEGEEQALLIDFALRRAEIERLLAALQAIGRTPPPAQALHPQGPIGAARASAMLAALTPALANEADRLAARLAAIEETQALRQRGLADLADGLERLGTARESLVSALAARSPEAAGEAAGAEGAADATAALARDSETLSVLSERLAALGPAAPATETGPLALGWPVAGRVTRGFREADAAGVRRPGLAIEAAPLSLVVAPARARVRYAGPFLDYGYVVVLEPQADTLVVLAGLATLETRAGAAVEAGAPLGLLGGRTLDAQEFLMLAGDASGETPGETLYIEVRQGQGPVDPTPLFADGNG